MPSFGNTDFSELQVATDLRSVFRNIPNTLSRTPPKSVTATYDYDTGAISYDFTERSTSSSSTTTSGTSSTTTGSGSTTTTSSGS